MLNNCRVVWWSVLVLAVVVVQSATPDPPAPETKTSGTLSSLVDCNGVIAFSATRGSAQVRFLPKYRFNPIFIWAWRNTLLQEDRVVLSETLIDKIVGYSAETGIFTVHCPGLYQISFAGYGSKDLRLTLKLRRPNSNNWEPVVSVGPNGGANLVLLNLDIGNHVAVFVDGGSLEDGVTFSAYRVAKKGYAWFIRHNVKRNYSRKFINFRSLSSFRFNSVM